jgi:hypothetical protein
MTRRSSSFDYNQTLCDNLDPSGKYAYSRLGDLPFIMMTNNKYINATHLCNGCNTRFEDWINNNESKLLMRALKDDVHIPVRRLVIHVNDERNPLINGTYVHPKLLIHIASWCSPQYAFKVSNIVIGYHVKENIKC